MNYFKVKTDARDARGKCGQEKLKKKLTESFCDRDLTECGDQWQGCNDGSEFGEDFSDRRIVHRRSPVDAERRKLEVG